MQFLAPAMVKPIHESSVVFHVEHPRGAGFALPAGRERTAGGAAGDDPGHQRFDQLLSSFCARRAKHDLPPTRARPLGRADPTLKPPPKRQGKLTA